MLLMFVVLTAAPVHLQYARAADASPCIGEEELRAAVVRRLGYVPFDDASTDVLRVDVARKPPGFVARVARTNSDGTRKGERELYTPRDDCSDLGETLAFAISVAIDPLVLFRGPADAGADAPVTAEVDAGAAVDTAPIDAGQPIDAGTPVVEPPPPAPAVVTEPSGGLAAGAAWGLAPGVALSVRGEGRLRWSFFSIGLQLRAELLGSLAVGDGAVSGTPVQAGLVPCFHWRGLAICGQVLGGAFIAAAAGLPAASTRVSPTASLGARLSYELVFGRIRPFAFVEGAAALARTSIFVGDTEVWISPPAWAGGGVGVFFGGP